MIKIAPSILSADFGNLISDIKKVEDSGADLLHIDVMDGHFVPNITFGPVVLRALTGKTKLPLDIHLMVEKPEKFIDYFLPLKPLYLTFHIEACRNIESLISHVSGLGIKVGLSINPDTPASHLFKYLEKIDLALVMSVNPGFSGQKFMPEVLPKIKELRERIEKYKLNIDLEVDGGIDGSNAKLVKEAGANILVAGSSLFGSSDYKAVIAALKK